MKIGEILIIFFDPITPISVDFFPLSKKIQVNQGWLSGNRVQVKIKRI